MQGEHQVSLLTAGTEAAQYQEQLRNVGKPAVTFATDDSQATHVSANKRQGSAGMLAKLYQASLARLSFGGKPSVRVDEDDFDESQVGDSSWQSCNSQIPSELLWRACACCVCTVRICFRSYERHTGR